MIKNITRNKVLEKTHKVAHSVLSKMLGLMFKSKINYGLVFIFNIEKKLNFHTLFMKISIDILFLNENKVVTKIIHNAKPWRLNLIGKGKYVIELNAGKSSNTAVGDKISFK